MKYFVIATMLCGLIITGCPAHTIHYMDARNGQERQRIEGSIGAFSTDIEVSSNHQAMESCLADTGEMPGGEEMDLCADQVRSDKVRRTRTLDWQSAPYYGVYGPYAPPVMYGY